VIVLDGIFDGDDVGLALFVDPVYHRGEGGGLSRAGGAGDENEATRAGEQVFDHGRKTDVIHLQKAAGDETEDHPIVSFGAKDTDAEAGLGAVGDGEVGTA